MEISKKRNAEKLRFGFVGGLNTTIDFGLLFVLTSLGFDKIASNYVSTTTAFLMSFTLNKKFTFKNNNPSSKKQFFTFAVVTLSGLWLIQPFIIFICLSLAESFSIGNQLGLVVAKLIATIVTLIWNYLFYSRFVFK